MLTDEERVLSANEAFYDAFAAGDSAAMQAIWSERAPVTCLHPGWPLLDELSAIRKSWDTILRNPGRPAITLVNPRVSLYGTRVLSQTDPEAAHETAVVICYEEIRGNYLLATNIFVAEDGVWRMVHHHSGGPVPPP